MVKDSAHECNYSYGLTGLQLVQFEIPTSSLLLKISKQKNPDTIPVWFDYSVYTNIDFI